MKTRLLTSIVIAVLVAFIGCLAVLVVVSSLRSARRESASVPGLVFYEGDEDTGVADLVSQANAMLANGDYAGAEAFQEYQRVVDLAPNSDLAVLARPRISALK